jgi:D-beta-D-heptose 7-phosphate kinase/D-beta-D-heptose 1-phosphate adenosyltransferase
MTELTNAQPYKSFNILLIGDSCIDRYNIGTVDRLSPEAPVPVLKIVESFNVQGMAANVNHNFKNLGIEVDFITNAEDIVKSRYIDKRSGQHMLRVDSDVEVCPWSGRIPFEYETYDAIVISDYNKGFLSYEHIEALIHYAKCPVFIDTKKTDLARFQGAWVKINQLESKLITSEPSGLIVTLGSKGARVWDEFFPTKEVEVTDVCGCGDTFLAALTAQYLFTKDIKKAILFANIAAGITVQHRGNYAPTYDEIRNGY